MGRTLPKSNMRSFELEMKHVIHDDITEVYTVFYEDDHIYTVESYSKEYDFNKLSKPAQDEITKALIQELMADRAELADRRCEV